MDLIFQISLAHFSSCKLKGSWYGSLLHKEGAKLFITDINDEMLNKYSKNFNATVVTGEEIYGLDVDIMVEAKMKELTILPYLK